MKINCPSCATQFSVPEAALGADGKKLRCAMCGHIWFQEPRPAGQGEKRKKKARQAEPALAAAAPAVAPPPPPPPPPPPEPEPEPEPAESEFPAEMDDDPFAGADAGDAAAEDGPDDDPFADAGSGDTAEGDDPFATGGFGAPGDDEDDPFAVKGDGEDDGKAGEADDPFGDDFDLDKELSDPTRFTVNNRDLPESKGSGLRRVLWSLVAVFAIVAGVGAAYRYQDMVIASVPAVAGLYEAVGARHEVVGAGLTFRNVKSERLRQQHGELLIVRGVIANVTPKRRDVPLLKLSLFQGDKVIQQKLAEPPAAELEPGATSAFRIAFENPDPGVTRMTVSFEPRGGQGDEKF